MSSFTDFITVVLADAAQIANANFGKVSGTVKSDDNNQVLTDTDIEIGNLIVGRIKSAYPDHNIIDEEAGAVDNQSKYTWIIDPIDGTSNFANGVPTYGVMLGLLEDGQPIAGGIALPYFNEVYTAEKGEGAFCNGRTIHVSQDSNLLNALVAYGIDGHQENPQLTSEETITLARIVLAIRNLRSSNSVFDLAQVMKGNYGAFLNKTSKIWDNVAPQILIQEAGGIYTDFYGEPIDYSDPIRKINDNLTVCAGSPSLHAQIQLLLRD